MDVRISIFSFFFGINGLSFCTSVICILSPIWLLPSRPNKRKVIGRELSWISSFVNWLTAREKECPAVPLWLSHSYLKFSCISWKVTVDPSIVSADRIVLTKHNVLGNYFHNRKEKVKIGTIEFREPRIEPQQITAWQGDYFPKDNHHILSSEEVLITALHILVRLHLFHPFLFLDRQV